MQPMSVPTAIARATFGSLGRPPPHAIHATDITSTHRTILISTSGHHGDTTILHQFPAQQAFLLRSLGEGALPGAPRQERDDAPAPRLSATVRLTRGKRRIHSARGARP